VRLEIFKGTVGINMVKDVIFHTAGGLSLLLFGVELMLKRLKKLVEQKQTFCGFLSRVFVFCVWDKY